MYYIKYLENPFRSLYEKDIIPSQPKGYLWRFRSKINFKHFSNTFNSQGLVTSVQYPLLAKFIQEEHLLAATEFLPGIVRLHLKLGQKYKYNRNNIDSHQTIQFFLKKVNEGELCYMDDNISVRLRKLMNIPYYLE